MNTTEWINRRFNTSFNEEDLASIKDFSLIWNVFEGMIFNNSFSINRLRELLHNRDLDINIFQSHITYFKERYISNGDLSSRFEYLHFRPGDRKELVEDVLLGKNLVPNDIIMAITIIIFRFRNNLFHGLKDIQVIDQQKDNFITANDFLIKFIEQC